MTMKTVCQFNKFGFCKFGVTCRHLHFSETCENNLCEISNCLKRHPTMCKYIKTYNRCKFGSFCSYKHDTNDVLSQNDDNEIETRFATFENQFLDLKAKIKEDDVKIKKLEEKIDYLEQNLKTVTESNKDVLETIIKKVTDEILQTISKKQDKFEKKQTESFDLLNKHLAFIIEQSQSRPSFPEHQAQSQQNPGSQTFSQPSPRPSLQCDRCGKTFGSEKALVNHARKDHAP